jgi:hypothetical protein
MTAPCARTSCRLNKAHLGLPCAVEGRDGRKCPEGEFATTLATALAEFGPWDEREAAGEPYAVMRARGANGERVEVWPHRFGADEVLVVAGRQSEIRWSDAAYPRALRDAVARACEFAGVRVQQTMEVE